MNDERDKTTEDRLVSDTYRELANERAPEALNDRILRVAAGTKPARNLIPGPWMKPVAWAATIGLSLAIVLELTQVPQIPPDIDRAPDGLTAEEPAALQPARVETIQESEVDDLGGRQLQMEKTAILEALPGAESQDTIRERRDLKPEVPRAEMPVIEEAAAQGMTRAPELTEAAAAVNDTVASDADSEVGTAHNTAAVSSMAAPTTRMLQAEPRLCPADTRESAEDWYRCIETQRAVSPEDAIASEIEALRERFPDFRIPDADK